jgi:hypothetical protein
MPTHPNLNIPLRVAIGLILLRLLLFWVNADFPFQEEIYLYVLLAAFPALTLYAIWPRKNPRGFKEDTFQALRTTLIFGFIMALFLFLFFKFIDTTFFPNWQDEIVAAELEAGGEVQEGELRKGVEGFFSIQNFAALTLIFFSAMGAFYSVLFSALKRLVLKQR